MVWGDDDAVVAVWCWIGIGLIWLGEFGRWWMDCWRS